MPDVYIIKEVTTMKKTRILALVLVAMLIFSLAACAPQTETTGSEPAGTTTTKEPGGTTTSSDQTAVTEGIELTVWAGQRSNVESLEDNRFTDYYEDLTGVHINWITYVDELSTQFNLSIASGEYPDMYLLPSFSTAQVQQAIDAGAIIPIDSYFSDYAPNFSKLMEIDPEMKKDLTAPDGHMYSFVRYLGFENYVTSHKLWIFEPWLEASGLDMPTTLDDLKEVLIYFRDNDMNGNGDPDDEAPMMGSSMILSNASDPMVAIIDCFEVITDDWLVADEDGNINTMATTDDYRAGLSYANMLFEEGLMAEETYTQDINTFRTVTSVSTDDQVIVGVTGGPDYARYVTSAYVNAYKNYNYIPPLKKDESSEPQTILQPRGYYMTSLITSECEYPEAAVKWLDTGLTPEIQVTSAFGWEDEHWTRISESPETGIVFELTDKSLYEEGAATQNQTWSLDWWEFGTYQGPLYRPFTQQYKEGTDIYYKETRQSEATEAYREFAKLSGIPTGNFWVQDDDLKAERAELSGLISEYIKASYTEFIMGVRDVDDDSVWQAYVDELNAMDLDRYFEISEQYYFGN